LIIALAVGFIVGFPLVCGAAFLLVWRISELHDRRLNDVMDRIQAPEAKQIAALDAVYQPRERAAVSDPFVDVPLDEDFRLAEILETS
jgi:hypothetical protein